mmetsp:Transcript_23552/g.75424  ORF Transcript_23552/g.75424 Transcript_23552/m.75424 type:complete len:294 (-) Transcript_23552:279-1160(-)
MSPVSRSQASQGTYQKSDYPPSRTLVLFQLPVGGEALRERACSAREAEREPVGRAHDCDLRHKVAHHLLVRGRHHAERAAEAAGGAVLQRSERVRQRHAERGHVEAEVRRARRRVRRRARRPLQHRRRHLDELNGEGRPRCAEPGGTGAVRREAAPWLVVEQRPERERLPHARDSQRRVAEAGRLCRVAPRHQRHQRRGRRVGAAPLRHVFAAPFRHVAAGELEAEPAQNALVARSHRPGEQRAPAPQVGVLARRVPQQLPGRRAALRRGGRTGQAQAARVHSERSGRVALQL